LEDRYGKAPDSVHYLLRFTVLKSLAERLGIEAIDRRQGAVNIKFHPESRVDPKRLMKLVGSVEGSQFTPAGVLRIPSDGHVSPADLLARLEQSLLQLV
jgi:transcription-repair coupling factor (superfamily II helicase)